MWVQAIGGVQDVSMDQQGPVGRLGLAPVDPEQVGCENWAVGWKGAIGGAAAIAEVKAVLGQPYGYLSGGGGTIATAGCYGFLQGDLGQGSYASGSAEVATSGLENNRRCPMCLHVDSISS